VPRYIKHLSKRELREKIAHLGLTSPRALSFVENAGEVVVIQRDNFQDGRKSFLALLTEKNVPFFSEKGKLLLSIREGGDIDALIEKAKNGNVRGHLNKVKRAVDSIGVRQPHILSRGEKIDLASRPPLIMGVINVTPDSFSDGGKYFNRERAVARGCEMAEMGADILDVGGESTRPGAEPVGPGEEMERVLPVIEDLVAKTEVLISVDTCKSDVAREALEAGAHMVNDISGLRHSENMAEVVAKYGAAVIIMHKKGTPRDMQDDPYYDSVPDEIIEFLEEGADLGKNRGINDACILFDPGIGFGKRYEDNLYILKNLEEFRSSGYPVVVGVSNKAFIGQATGKSVSDRVFGTIACVSLAVYNGADVVRVHDVAAIKDTVLMAWEIKRGRIC
jgi:dihydropteroate synthase